MVSAVPEIRKFLTCAAHHLPLDFAKHLEEAPLEQWRVAGGRTPFGFFVYAHDEDGNGPGDNIPAEVMAIFAYAREHGCDYVYFDRDADDLDGFPVFEDEALCPHGYSIASGICGPCNAAPANSN